MPSSHNADPIPGNLDADGSVRCSCGKKSGEMTDEGAEFFCHGCRRPVTISYARMKHHGLLCAISGINSATTAIASGMTAIQTLAAQLAALPH